MTDNRIAQIVSAKHCDEGHTWRQIGDHLGWTRTKTRAKYLRRDKERYPKDAMPEPCPLCFKRPDREGMSWQEQGNYAEADGESPGIENIEALEAALDVDLDTWLRLDWGFKRWQVGAKIKTGELHWGEDGKIGEGSHLSYKGLGKENLWSLWAKYIRREPIMVMPAIQPISCEVRFDKPPRPSGEGLRRALIGADAQLGFCLPEVCGELVPFHDRVAIDCFIQLAADLQPDLIVLLGDWNDLPEWTDKFVRSPEFQRLTQPALTEGHYIRRRLREACPNSRIEEHEGNHEKRMPDFIAAHLAAAANLKRADQMHMAPVLSIPYLLALDSLGIEWVSGYPNDEAWLYDGLRVVHGDMVSSVPGATARKYVDDSEESVIFAHIHRRESASETKRTRYGLRTVEARGIGCLCRIDGGVPARSDRNNWQQSVAIVDYSDDDHNIYDVEIKEGRAIWNGHTYQGADYVDDLRRQLGDWKW